MIRRILRRLSFASFALPLALVWGCDVKGPDQCTVDCEEAEADCSEGCDDDECEEQCSADFEDCQVECSKD